MKHEYYFDIHKDAEISHDEYGNPVEAKLAASFDSEETYYTEQQMLRYISEISNIPQEYLRLISKEEYEREEITP